LGSARAPPGWPRRKVARAPPATPRTQSRARDPVDQIPLVIEVQSK